jgi:WD40 repeat protein
MQEIKVWDVATAKELRTLKGHSAWVTSAAFSPDGWSIATSGQDPTANVWDLAGDNDVRIVPDYGTEAFIVLSKDGQKIVTGRLEPTTKQWMAQMWDVTSGKELLTLDGIAGRIRSVDVSTDGRMIVAAIWGDDPKGWDAVSGKELFTLRGHKREVLDVAVSPSGRWIVTGSEADQTAKVWDAATRQE